MMEFLELSSLIMSAIISVIILCGYGETFYY
jgi:hypothetical protein